MSRLLPLLLCACTGLPDTPLDHASSDVDLWLCRPGDEDNCEPPTTTQYIWEDGLVDERVLKPLRRDMPACFVVHPTLDFDLHPRLHHDAEDWRPAHAWMEGHMPPMVDACEVWAPSYRQATIGTYMPPRTERKERLTDAAFLDIESAFDVFLDANPERPIVLFGHSQGSHMLAKLIRRRIDDDPVLRDRLVAAYLIGWPIGTPVGEDVGGSFQVVPVCREADQTGCVIGYRSTIAERRPPNVGVWQEGEEQVCVHPGVPDDPDADEILREFIAGSEIGVARLPDSVTPKDDLMVSWPAGFQARCVGEGQERVLEVDWIRDDDPPVGLRQINLTVGVGAHVIDIELGVADMIVDIQRRTRAWWGSGTTRAGL